MITVTYSTIDHFRKTRKFKTLAGARKFAWHWIGRHPEMGGTYAVSFDGVGKITANVSLNSLFPERDDESGPVGDGEREEAANDAWARRMGFND